MRRLRIADCGVRIGPALRRRGERAFTMIEIAFCLAIVAFALVAIMGVLPTGMTVQKDNREDTLVNNDANFWLESLRSGSRGLDDLTNYVESITITNNKGQVTVVTNNWNKPGNQIISGEQIVGMLLTPKYMADGNTTNLITNTVIARVRAINGPAVEKGNPFNEFSFRYELRPELVSLAPTPVNGSNFWGTVHDQNVASNYHQLRLTLRWPMFQQGNTYGVGRNRRTVRTAVNGKLAAINAETLPGTNGFIFVQPNVYAYVPRP